MKSPEDIANITDPIERLRQSAKYVADTEAKVAAVRADRDMAIIVAALDHHVPPVRIYRDTLGIARNLFNRIMARAPVNRPEIKDPLKVAKAKHKRATQMPVDLRIDFVREIRDTTALNLMNGYADDGERVPPVSNADVSRIANLSTARVAQLRKTG